MTGAASYLLLLLQDIISIVYIMIVKTTVPRVAIVGTGAFAQGLGAQAVRSGAVHSYSLCFSSRKVG
jgi:hypothetical protein